MYYLAKKKILHRKVNVIWDSVTSEKKNASIWLNFLSIVFLSRLKSFKEHLWLKDKIFIQKMEVSQSDVSEIPLTKDISRLIASLPFWCVLSSTSPEFLMMLPWDISVFHLHMPLLSSHTPSVFFHLSNFLARDFVPNKC